MKTSTISRVDWRLFLSISAMVAVAAMVASTVGGCGGSDGGGGVLAPGEPTNLTVVRTPETTLSATVTWEAPLSGGAPDTYEIYRSTTAGTVFQADNHVISIPAVAGQTTPYSFIDNAGLTPVNTYWVVSAKNAGGETPTGEVLYKPIGSPSGGGGDEGYGNNFAAALIFADDYGITGQPVTGTWTSDLNAIDVGTGFRPVTEQVTTLLAAVPAVTTLPYLNPGNAFVSGGVTYYKQQTPSTWQGEWAKGASELQRVTAKWGDNLISQRFTDNSVIRIEMVLSKALTVPMTSYTMKSLYGTKRNEIFGTDGTTYDNLTAFVFAANAQITIQKMDGATNPVLLDHQSLWAGDGPGYLAGEVNVGGNFTYGFVWELGKQVLPGTIPTKSGTWRIIFSLADFAPAPVGTGNNTSIDGVANGVHDSPTEVHIDIEVQ